MSDKMDRQGARTATDLERKYQFGKKFQEIMGICEDLRGSISVVDSNLRHEILEQVTSITRSTEAIVMNALESYVETDDLGEFKATLESEFKVMAEKISMGFYADTEEQINGVEGDVQTVQETLEKHFEFSANGLVIKSTEGQFKLLLDNNTISFYKGEIDFNDLAKNRFGYWDGINFYTGNIFVDVEERAQFGNFAFVPRSNGSLDFLKVGG
jgi:hypothetical protein